MGAQPASGKNRFVRLPKLPRHRPRPIPEFMFPDEEDEQAARGGYVFTADPGARLISLTEPISKQADRFCVSAPHELVSGQCYLLGGPERPDCEVVEVEVGEPVAGNPRRIRRAMFKTLSSIHPAGTPVTAVTVTFVEDWAQQEP
jgi:hypothetical protein